MDILIRTSHPDTSTTVHVGMRTHTFDTKAAALLAVAMYLEVNCSLVAPPTADNVEGANLQPHNNARDEICQTCGGHGHVWSAFNEILYCRECSGTGKLSPVA